MSSTYFMPASPSRVITKNARTMSYDIKEKSRENVHFRSLSSVPRESPMITQKSSSDFSFVEKKCSICCEKECNSVLMDCGHGGICLECANFLMKNKGQCHMCRGIITQVHKIHVEPNKILKVIGTNSNLDS